MLHTPDFLSDQAHIRGADLIPLAKHLGLKTNRMCEQVGVTPHTWYVWQRAEEKPISSRIVELHLRLLAAMPDLTQIKLHPLDLQEALRTQRGIEMTLGEIALLLGIESRNAYSWSYGVGISAQIEALTATLMKVVAQKSRLVWEQYHAIVDRQAALEGVNIWETKSWTPTPDPQDDVPVEPEPEPPPKRGGRRGRFEPSNPAPAPDDSTTSSPPKRKRGRPKKL